MAYRNNQTRVIEGDIPQEVEYQQCGICDGVFDRENTTFFPIPAMHVCEACRPDFEKEEAEELNS